MIDPRRLAAMAEQVVGEMPHPQAPELTVKEYRAHVKAASMLAGEQGARPSDVVDAYHLLRNLELSPAQFEHAWTLAAPVANRLLGRDPMPQEIKQLAGLHPADVHEYFRSSPYPGHEEVTAGEMARWYHAAKPIANATVGRDPLLNEVARFAAAGYDSDAMHTHYAQEKG